ncbi:cobalamin biosynthesis protein [Nocardia sp. NPDC127526]|uniref:cobalamin biosynthesis protein n=1 Tax=Nocardia sp. NPDC127526 TaxID=3345393 RepID=UPI0036299182
MGDAAGERVRGELAVGVGMRVGATPEAVVAAVREAVGERDIGCLTSVDRRAGEPGLAAAAEYLGVPVVVFSPEELATVAVPTPSARTARAIGTPSVAEAAALLAAGSDRLVVRKRVIAGITVAAAVIRERGET